MNNNTTRRVLEDVPVRGCRGAATCDMTVARGGWVRMTVYTLFVVKVLHKDSRLQTAPKPSLTALISDKFVLPSDSH